MTFRLTYDQDSRRLRVYFEQRIIEQFRSSDSVEPCMCAQKCWGWAALRCVLTHEIADELQLGVLPRVEWFTYDDPDDEWESLDGIEIHLPRMISTEMGRLGPWLQRLDAEQ